MHRQKHSTKFRNTLLKLHANEHFKLGRELAYTNLPLFSSSSRSSLPLCHTSSAFRCICIKHPPEYLCNLVNQMQGLIWLNPQTCTFKKTLQGYFYTGSFPQFGLLCCSTANPSCKTKMGAEARSKQWESDQHSCTERAWSFRATPANLGQGLQLRPGASQPCVVPSCALLLLPPSIMDLTAWPVSSTS